MRRKSVRSGKRSDAISATTMLPTKMNRTEILVVLRHIKVVVVVPAAVEGTNVDPDLGEASASDFVHGTYRISTRRSLFF